MADREIELSDIAALEFEMRDIAKYGHIYYCPSCTHTDCPHRNNFLRVPKPFGLGLCQGHSKEEKRDG